MRTLLLTLSLCLIAGLAACRSSEKDIQPPAQESQQTSRTSSDVVTPAAPVELTVEGELKSINADAKTLVIKDASGSERTFSFSDSTGIIGAPGAQGLSGKQGSHVRVGYVMQGDISSANWIEISPATKDSERK
jgi:hypothetical protein